MAERLRINTEDISLDIVDQNGVLGLSEVLETDEIPFEDLPRTAQNELLILKQFGY